METKIVTVRIPVRKEVVKKRKNKRGFPFILPVAMMLAVIIGGIAFAAPATSAQVTPQESPALAYKQTKLQMNKEIIPETLSEDNKILVEAVIPEEITPAPEVEPTTMLIGNCRVTFYCYCVKCCGIWSQEHPSRVGTDYVQLTSTGTKATANRTIAVDPDVIPLGSAVHIEGLGDFIAEDTGSGVKGNHVDVYVDEHDNAFVEAAKLGDYADVFLIKE